MWQAEYRLYLYPTDINKEIDQNQLEEGLRKIEFIGECLGENRGSNRYKVGEAFLSLICFMGCSPNIEMEPQEERPFCYVEIPEEVNTAHFIAGDNVKTVNCPRCKKSQIKLIENLLEADAETLFLQQCTECGEKIEPSAINWRKSAFIAKTWVLLGNIYESEAVPDEKLLSALEKASGCEWKYAYVRLKSL